MNSQSSVVVVGIPPGEITSPTNSLTWRELFMGLTTYLFKPQYEKNIKVRDGSAITEVHNGRGLTMAEVQQKKWILL